MNELDTDGSLELEVSDFGPIREAKIDLRPMTVFVGPSNTGKSYLAILIYALHRFFNQEIQFPSRLSHGQSIDIAIPDASLNAIYETIETLIRISESHSEHEIELTPEVVKAISLFFERSERALAHEVVRSFGIPQVDLLTRRRSTVNSQITLRRKLSDHTANIEHTFTLSDKPNYKTSIPAGVRISIAEDQNSLIRRFLQSHEVRLDEIDHVKENSRRSVAVCIELLAELFLRKAAGSFHFPAHYLPADRTGLMRAHSLVVRSLIDSATLTGLRPKARTPLLSGVLADFLTELITLDRRGISPRIVGAELSKTIEKEILDGSVRVDRSLVDYPSFAYRPKGWKDDLALANTSSTVSELAPVVLFLRHVVERGDVLILEEPEAHLHPAMQVKLIRQLAELVNIGVRVIITTHSEWILEELANIMLRSEIPDSKSGIPECKEIALQPRQVGAWLFEPKKRPKGSIVKEMRIDDGGLFPADFSEVALTLHNEWAEITSQIENAE